jgi:hypothetical protein
MLVVDFIYRLLSGTLTNMEAYIDLDAGTLQTVPATPATVARMAGLKVSELMTNKCGKVCGTTYDQAGGLFNQSLNGHRGRTGSLL